jgi:hypothetical protein
MDHARLDAAALKPAREPEAVAAGFVGDGDAGDWTPRLDRFTSPALKKAEQLSASGSIFFLGWRSTPGIRPATSQLFSLSSTTITKALCS